MHQIEIASKMRIIILLTFLATIVYVQCQPSKEYVVNQAAGKAYKLVYESRTWKSAKRICERDAAKLAIPKNQDEFEFIQNLVHGMRYKDITGTSYKLLVWVGINNLENYKVWKNVDGDNIESTGFHTFAGDNGNGYSDNPAEPHCVGVDPANFGLRSYWCHHQQPYVCEKPAEGSD